MRQLFALLLAATMLLGMTACGGNHDTPGTDPSSESIPGESTGETTDTAPSDPAPTDPTGSVDDKPLIYNGERYASLYEIMEKLDEDGFLDVSTYTVEIGGLCAPVALHMAYSRLVSISAFDHTVYVDTEAWDYSFLYGNTTAYLYDYQDAIILNLWTDSIGYSCVMTSQGSSVDYPSGGTSRMVYVSEDGQLQWSKTSCKFNRPMQQRDIAPIDLATSRDEFYYAIGNASFEGGSVQYGEAVHYTISDVFDLDTAFADAKAQGQYAEFDTVDELLAYNLYLEETDPDLAPGEDPYSYRIRKVYDDDGNLIELNEYYGDTMTARFIYDKNGNLIQEIGYHVYGVEHYTFDHEYDAQGREIAGRHSFFGDDVDYRYTLAYDDAGNLTEKVYYENDQETERFVYTYDSDGNRTSEIFSQAGIKKYGYEFNKNGDLIKHISYQDGIAVEHENVDDLIKAQLVTGVWFPIMDSEPIHSRFHYDGAEPISPPLAGEITYHDDGSWTLIHGSYDDEDGLYYESEHLYDENGLLIRTIYRTEGVETGHYVYTYDDNGNRVKFESYEDGSVQSYTLYEYDASDLLVTEVDYSDGQETCRRENEYDASGRLIYFTIHYTEVDDDNNGISHTEYSTQYIYNEKGWLIETIQFENGVESFRDTYEYDEAGRILKNPEYYQYVYDENGMLSRIRIAYDEWVTGDVVFHYRTVYVTPETAEALRQIINDELSWF